MKITILVALVLCIFAAYSQAQRLCGGQPPQQDCTSPRNVGRGVRGCQRRTMWYYGNGECRSMLYFGCGGNRNRYCTKADCERKCRRSD